MKMIRRVIALVLTAVMLIQPLTFAASVTDFYDFPNDWSTEAMTAAVKNDLLRGDGDGFINPGRNLTRAELAAIMVRAFGATIMSNEQKFNDVKTADWFYNDVYKAVQMQIMQGTGETTFAPQASITRQEVFTVVARALCLTDGDSVGLGKFSDSNEISDWAEAPIAALIENNYINGYPDGTLDPLGKITRAELAQLLHNLFRTYISVGGYYMTVAEGSVVVRTSDVHLENLTINGDLIIADGVGAGNFDLKSVTVNGRILARGGEGAVTFKDVKVTDGVIIFDPNGTVNFRNYRDEAPFKNLTELTPATFLKKQQDNGYVGGDSGGGGGSTTFETVDTAITLTAPVTGAVPQTTIDAPTYTATVQWSPVVSGTFAGDVAYTATITVTPKSGYTLTGVGADSYTVNGNATTHAANAGTVSVSFPKTEPTVIDTAITLTAPVAGQTPQTSINAETYTAQVVWNPAVSGTFAHYTDYEATITITPKAGYTLNGVAANSYTVNGNATTHVANSGVVSYIFDKTAPAVVDRNITLTAPVVGETPQTTIDAPTYTATVNWSPAVAGTFDYYTDYTATISITPKTGYTLTGVAANSYTVNGNATTHAANTGEVSYTFPKTESKPIDRTLPLTIPAIDNVPMRSFSGEGYTATVVWTPAHSVFGYDTDYVATITINLEDGYRVPDEAYIVAGADSVVTNGNKTVVTAKFAKFGSTPITGAFEIEEPVAGNVPQTSIETAQYKAEIVWSPTVNGTFDYNTVYTAEIRIVETKEGFTVNGVPANSYTVNGNATTHGANANVVTYTFPRTEDAVIDTAITLTAPVAGEEPQTTIDDNDTYTATVEWTPAVSGTFGYYQDYTATITITPKTGYTLTGVSANSYTVNGNATTHSANAGVVVYTFPKTEPAVIDTAITVTSPVAGEAPQTTIDAESYTATVVWAPTVSGTFAYYTDYQATITITPREGYTLAGVLANSYTVNGNATTHVAGSNAVTYAFPKTEPAVIDTAITLTAPVAEEVPQTAIDAETYTATVVWIPTVSGTFDYYTEYKATITITPKTGYTLTGVAANSYTVNGISINHAANAGVVEYTFPKTAPAVIGTEINLAEPVAGEIPQTEIDAPTYKAVVEWKPTVVGTFGYYTEYTAKITIEPKTGYTVTGVAADSYKVNGNATTHAADSNVVEYTFTKTEEKPLSNEISIVSPVPGETPGTSFVGEGYTANVSWTGELSPAGKFKYDVEYTATVTITPNTGFTYPVEPEYIWSGTGTVKSMTTSADKKQVTVEFYETKSTDINGMLNITAPVANKVCVQPAGTVLTGTGYSATVTSWSDGFLADNKFKYGTEYTVTVEVTLEDGYSVPASGFSVVGTTEVTNTPVDANGKTTVTVKFPVTDNLVGKEINVTAPVANAINTSNTVTGDGFTATIEWIPAVAVGGKFAYDTTYTAKITVMPDDGYTLDGIGEDEFVVTGAKSDTNAANSDTVNATFAKTDALVGNEINVTVPVAYEINPSNTVTGDGFTATIEWNPVLNAGDRFAHDTVYTATITVAPNAGYTLEGVDVNYFEVPGAVSVSNDANSGTVIATFAKTDKLVGNIINVTKPTAGIVNTSNTVTGDGFTANIEWSPAVNVGDAFDYDTVYTATVTVAPKTGYTLNGVSEDYFVINNAVSASNDENAGTVIATFERTAKRIGNRFTITQPRAHADTYETSISGEGFIGTVSWTPNPVLTGSYYNYSTEYTAKVTITPTNGYTVDGIPAASNFFTVSVKDPAGFVQIKDGFVPQTVITTSGGVKVAVVEIPFTETEAKLGADIGDETPTPSVTEDYFKATISDDVVAGSGGTVESATTELTYNASTVDSWKQEAIENGADISLFGLLASDNIAYGQVYYARIEVTAADGYTARGIMQNEDPFTTVNPDTEIVTWWVKPGSDGNVAIVIVRFPKTLDAVNRVLDITAPVPEIAPVTKVVHESYLGGETAVNWFVKDKNTNQWVAHTGDFWYNREYKAELTITPADGFTTEGFNENSFEVSDNATVISVKYDTATSKVTVEYQITDKKEISSALGLTEPVVHVAPSDSFSGEGYTAAVEWAPDDATFKYDTVYVATVHLTLEEDYKVPTGDYTVAGSQSVVADTDKLTVTVTYAAIETEPIHTEFAVTEPVPGGLPQTSVDCGNADGCYTADVEWFCYENGAFVPFTGTEFGYNRIYKAKISIEPIDGYSTLRIPANTYTVNGVTATHDEGADEFEFTFDITEKKKIDKTLPLEIPEIDATPMYTFIGEGYTADVEWNLVAGETVFGYDKEYIATVTIDLEADYSVPDEDYVVNGAKSVTSDADKLVVTVVFNVINSTTIHTSLELTAPVAGETPVRQIVCTDASADGCFTAEVKWFDADGNELVETGTETFAYGTVYTAKITITPATGFTTVGIPENGYTVNGEATVHPENANVVEFTFPETENEYIVRFFDGYGQYFEDATLYNADLNEAEGVYTVKEGTFPHEITAYDGVDVLDTKFGFIRDYSMLLSGDAKSGVDAVDERYKNNEIHEIKNTYWYVKDGVWTEFDSTVELEPGITNVFINSQLIDLKIEVPKIADFSLDLKTNYEVDGRVADAFKDIIFAEGNEQNIIRIFSDEKITAKLLEKLVEKELIDADGNILNQHREIYLVDVLGKARLRQMIDDVVGDAIAEDGDIVGEIIERFETFDDSQKEHVVEAFHKLFESILEKELDATMKNEVRTVVYDFFDAMSLEDIKAIVNAHIAHMIEGGREAEVRTLMEDMLQVYKDADYDGLKSYVTTFIKDNKNDSDISAELTKYIKSEIKAGNLNDELKGYIAGYDGYDTVVEFVAGEDLETLVDALGLKSDVDFVKSAIYSAIDMNRADFKESIRVSAGIDPEIFEQLTNADIKDAVDEYIEENGISGFGEVINDAIDLVDSDADLKAEIIEDHIKTLSKATVAEKIVEMLDSDSSYFDKPVINNVIDYAVAEKLKNIDDGTISDYADTVVGTQGVDDDKFEILSGAYVSVNTSTRETITGDIIESLYAEDDFKKIIDKFIDDIFKSKKVDIEIIEYMVDHLSDASAEAKADLEILLEDVAHDGVLLGDLAHALGIQEVEEKYEFIEQLIDELCNKKPVTVTADRAFMFDAVLAKFNEFTYEDMESKIPAKLLQFLPREVMETLYNRFLFDEGGYVYELEKALANAKANEGTEYYITSYGAVDFNPVDDVVAPIFKFYYEKFENIDDSNRFKELYAEYFLGNPYAVAMKEYFVNSDGSANIALWFDGTANDYKEEKSGYSLKPFAYTNSEGDADIAVIPGRSYMDNIQALSVLSDDAMFYFYNNGYETARDEYLEKIYDKAMEYKEIFEGKNGLPTFEELTNKVGKFEDNATAKRVYEFVVRQLKSRGLDKRIISICERIPEDESKKDEAIERTELFYTVGTVADMFDYIKKAKEIIAEKTDKINKIDIVEENGRFSITIDKGDNIISFLSDFCYDEDDADAIIEYWESEGI